MSRPTKLTPEMERFCKYCEQQKPVTEFASNHRCKDCRRKQQRERYHRPEVKEHERQYRLRPEVKERNSENGKEYRSRPEVKERTQKRQREYGLEYRSRSEVIEHTRERKKKYFQRPEVKAKNRERNRSPERKAQVREYVQRPEVRKRARQYARDYYQRPEQKTYKQEYQQRPEVKERIRIRSHSRRAMKAGLPYSVTCDQWEYALNYFNGCCAVCERQINDMFGEFCAAQDHWIPQSRNGEYSAKNIVPLCHGLGGCNNKKGNTLPAVWLLSEYGKEKATQILGRIESYFEHIRGIMDNEE